MDLLESHAPFTVNGQFTDAVQKYLKEHLGDWADDFPNLAQSIRKTWKTMASITLLQGGKIRVYREELRPAEQIAEMNYGSIGACWSYDISGARTCNHDNAYDEHGRDVVAVLFYGFVSVTDVDWVQTMAKNLVLIGEREINILDGASIEIAGQKPHGALRFSQNHFVARISNESDF